MFKSLIKKVTDTFNNKDITDRPVNNVTNPLDVKIGSNIVIRNNNALVYKLALKKLPAYDIHSISKISISNVVTAYRFYDGVQSACKFSPAENFIQILVSERNNEIIECRLFQLIEDILPQTTVEWATWVGENGSIIGSRGININNEEYVRVDSWANSNDEYVRGKHFTENIYEMTDGSVKSLVKHEAMLYGKWKHEEHQIAEYVLVSSIELTANPKSRVFLVGADRIDGISMYRGMDVPVSDVVINF